VHLVACSSVNPQSGPPGIKCGWVSGDGDAKHVVDLLAPLILKLGKSVVPGTKLRFMAGASIETMVDQTETRGARRSVLVSVGVNLAEALGWESLRG